MGWEHRHGRPFYYRKVREGKRVRSIYIGNGEEAYLCSEMVEEKHHHDQRERMFRESENAIERQLAALNAQTATITKETLTTAGFHQHKGTWRKRRLKHPKH
jgi:hypothetical protein